MSNFNIEEEFATLKIGTGHNKKRFLRVIGNMVRKPGRSIISQSSSRTEAKGAYRLLNNDNLNMDEIVYTHRFRTIERIYETERPILLVQDTTFVNYQTQIKKEGLGKMNNNPRGIKVHSCIALSSNGINLGVMHQKSWSPDQSDYEIMTEHERKSRPIEEKESYRWIESFHESNLLLPADLDVTVISDREGDIYEYMNHVISHKRFFLTRIAQNRMTTENQKVFDAIRSEKSQGEIIVQVPRNTAKNLKSRKAKLALRFKQYEINRPSNLKNNENLPQTLTVWVVHAKEIKPPSSIDPIEWFLMTNRPITNVEAAFKQLKNYSHRWKIERFHHVLKSGGCNIEKIQARSVKVTCTLILLNSIIAVFIMNLTYAARHTPEQPCSDFFEDEEWKVLYCLHHKTGTPPDIPYTIKDAVKYLSALGAGKRAPSDGDPGVKLIWDGLANLYIILEYKETIKLMGQV